MFRYALHNTIGISRRTFGGLQQIYGTFFADDGFGNFVRVDTVTANFSIFGA